MAVIASGSVGALTANAVALFVPGSVRMPALTPVRLPVQAA